MDWKLIFSEIQSICVDVAKKRDLQSIQVLDKYLEDIIEKEKTINEPISVLNGLKEYVAFPLVLTLKNEKFNGKGSQSLLESIFSCLQKVLSNSYSIDWNFFQDVFLLIFLRITSPDNPQIVGDISEECKIEALQNAICLCNLLPSEHWSKLYAQDFRPQLGHAVYICLQMAEKEKNRSLKITAINAIEELALKTRSYLFDKGTAEMLGFLFANFLPGIAMTTTRIATATEIQGHKVTVAAIQCWEYFLVLVMQDTFLSAVVEGYGMSKSFAELQGKMFPSKKNDKKPHKISQVSDSVEEKEPRLRNVVIDQNWVENTTSKLSILAQSLFTLVSHSHWKVRLTLVGCSQSLFQRCSSSMKTCLILSLETLVTLKNDPVADVSEAATDALNLLKESFDQANDEEGLLEMLEERVFALTTKLPTLVRTQDDAKLLSSMRQLNGSLEFLGSRIHDLVHLPFHLDRLLRAFLLLLTYDYSDSDLLLEKTMAEDPLEVMSIKPRLGLSFRYFRSDAIVACISTCCYLVGQHGDLFTVVDHCVDLIGESSFHRNEAVLLLNLILKGAINEDGTLSPMLLDRKERLVDSVLDVILRNDILEAPLSVSQNTKNIGVSTDEAALVSFRSFKPSISVDVAKRNIILVSNSLLVIGTCALVLGKGFNVFLSRVLCPVMEKAGDSYVLVSHSALLALDDLAKASQYSSVAELIENGVPFIWFTLSQKLKRLPDYPSSPQVLKVALRCQQGKVKAFVEELVEDVLDSLDTFHSQSPLPLLTVILSFVEALARQQEAEEREKPSDDEVSSCGGPKYQTLLEFMEEVHATHEAIDRETKDVEMQEDEEASALSAEEGFQIHLAEEEERKKKYEEEGEPTFQEEPKKDSPKQVKLVVRILERCSYLLFTKERKIQMVTLQIIEHCCHILGNWEDEKLPCFHKVWKPLALRLKDKDFVVLLKALEVCVLMVKQSGDFLRRRFLQELFPSLLLFLESQSSTSLNKTRKSGYYITPAFKAQYHVLENIPSLLRGLELDVLESGELLNVILSYVDDRQPHPLNQLAFQALKTLKELHPDLVWLALAFSKGPFRITPPSPLLNPVVVHGIKNETLSKEACLLYEELS